jgi:hypothetical protein
MLREIVELSDSFERWVAKLGARPQLSQQLSRPKLRYQCFDILACISDS